MVYEISVCILYSRQYSIRVELDLYASFVLITSYLFTPGRRVCLGEQLANVELFIFTAALLKNFSFSAPGGVEVSPRNLFVEQKFVIERRTVP